MIDLLEKSDQEWANTFGITIEQFRGEEPYDPVIPSHYPCGYDDYVMDKIDSIKDVISQRKELNRA